MNWGVLILAPTKEAGMGERIKGKTLVASDEGDDAHGVIIKLYSEHGIQFFDDWIAELKAAYNLRVIGE
jgi:hypothetical protein